jgi:hypothetical protein
MFRSITYPVIEVQKAEESWFHLGRGTAGRRYPGRNDVGGRHDVRHAELVMEARHDLGGILDCLLRSQ